MIGDSDLVKFLDEYLSIEEIEDDGINGIQVDAQVPVEKAAFAVDARKDIISKAVDKDADILVVHHGLFWGDGIERLRGRMYDLIEPLIDSDTGLYMAHLPLDVHDEIGNNVELAKLIGANIGESFMEYKGTKIARMAELREKRRVKNIAQEIEEKLNTETFVLKGDRSVKNLGILTGKGGKALEEAKNVGSDLFITGERTYTAYNTALDLDMSLIFAGHYATETLGIKKLKELVKKKFDIKTCFIAGKTTI